MLEEIISGKFTGMLEHTYKIIIWIKSSVSISAYSKFHKIRNKTDFNANRARQIHFSTSDWDMNNNIVIISKCATKYLINVGLVESESNKSESLGIHIKI